MQEPLAYTVEQFIGAVKVGRTKVYAEIASGRLATYTLGRRRYISAHAAAEWQRRLEAEANAGNQAPHSAAAA
jgi:hypothetical protein